MNRNQAQFLRSLIREALEERPATTIKITLPLTEIDMMLLAGNLTDPGPFRTWPVAEIAHDLLLSRHADFLPLIRAVVRDEAPVSLNVIVMGQSIVPELHTSCAWKFMISLEGPRFEEASQQDQMHDDHAPPADEQGLDDWGDEGGDAIEPLLGPIDPRTRPLVGAEERRPGTHHNKFLATYQKADVIFLGTDGRRHVLPPRESHGLFLGEQIDMQNKDPDRVVIDPVILLDEIIRKISNSIAWDVVGVITQAHKYGLLPAP